MDISFIPKWLIRLFYSEYRLQYELNILLSNILILILFLIFKYSLISLMNSLPHFCLFDKILGIECPVCGTTRALCEMATGNLKNAYNLNLSSFFVASFFVIQIPLRTISLFNNGLIKKTNNFSKYFSGLVCVVILANWIINLFLH